MPTLPLPILASGDRRTREEFERRYAATPHLCKAELIEGVVVPPAALRLNSHSRPYALLLAWLADYWVATPGVDLGVEPTVRLDGANVPQPDAVLMIEPSLGGQARLSEDDYYIEGAPELVAEIAASSAAIEVGDKKQVYCRNGVQEYIVWQVFAARLDWFVWQDGVYSPLPADGQGIIRSRIFPGLGLATTDLLAGNIQPVLTVLQQGLYSSEYAAFKQQLVGRG